MDKDKLTMIGAYGSWAAGQVLPDPPALSLRTGNFQDLGEWRAKARARVAGLLMEPDTGGIPEGQCLKTEIHEGLHIEHLTWQLPYGPPTRALFLKPADAVGPLPGVLALHDHGGNKYFGQRKITRTGDKIHPIMRKHQRDHYGDRGWANALAAKGYGVLVSDAFPFASRRVLLGDVVPELVGETREISPAETEAEINAYNEWAGQHEHVMAKSLFYSGTTWPGVFLSEDRRALDYLCSRPDIDSDRVGCGGLSGGGMRTIFLGGMDERIRCAVCVGLMSTHRDYVLNKCWTHTWMMAVPGLSRELDYPELLGLRVPLPTMVLNDEDDQLFTLPEMQRADTILKEVFAFADASEKYACNFYPGPHKFDLEMQADAFSWFDQWLKPAGAELPA